MTEQHENFVNVYFDAVQCGSSDDIYDAVVALKKFEQCALKNNEIKEEDVVIKSVLIKD